MKQIKFILITFIITQINLVAQDIPDMQLKNLNPVSPTTYQFLKFGEIPVNEYTGSPIIEIPLFDIDIKGFSLPIKLQYHSKGIKVSEEADWVGLGWDLSFGAITQVVNDKDDLDLRYTQNTLPYLMSSMPYTWIYSNETAPTFSMMTIDNTNYINDRTYSFVTYQQSINNIGWKANINFGLLNTTDFEKDIFVASVLGEQLYIIIKNRALAGDFSNYQFKVLNKKGYKVNCTPTSFNTFLWQIVTPSGLTCYYNETNNIQNLISTESSSLPVLGETSRIWQISKIKTIYGDSISFNYSPKKILGTSSISQQWKIAKNISSGDIDLSPGPGGEPYNGGASLALDYKGPLVVVNPTAASSGLPRYFSNQSNGGDIDYIVTTNIAFNQERSYLTSITYNQNTISFSSSERTDWANSKKLDSIVVTNLQQQKIHSLRLKYSNYQSSSDTRLKLDSIINQEDKYIFTYNSTPLPAKKSYAVDFWGYYNGQTSNTNLLPNIYNFDFNATDYINRFGNALTKNTNIKYSVLDYSKAGILESIQYPTGGTSKFHYSLNCFDNYKVPTDPTYNTPNLYYGNGLRIDSIINYISTGSIASIKYYQYKGGKLDIPLRCFFNKREDYTKIDIGWSLATYYSADILNICSSGCYVPNLLGEGNGVGYDKVESWHINHLTRSSTNGKTIHYYSNKPAIFYSIDLEYAKTVPAYHSGFNNGTLLKEELYDNINKRISVSQLQYSISSDSVVEYNSRASYLGQWGNFNGYKAMLVSYYPLYKPETLLKSKRKVDYFNNDSVVTNESYFYNNFNLIYYKSKNMSNAAQDKEDSYYYPFDIINNYQYTQEQQNVMQDLITNNRLNEVVKSQNSVRTCGTLTTKTKYIEYDPTTRLPNAVKVSLGNNPLETQVSFKYDSKKNIVEKTEADGIPTAYLWAYNYQYPIAEIKNATYAQVSNALGIAPATIAVSSMPNMTKVNALRTSLPNSLITTYTFKPLVGMTSKTDPRGVTTHYLYDSFGRLGLVKDKDLNIAGLYRYAYRNVPETDISSSTNTPVAATIVKNDVTYLNTNTTASLTINGGSGNFGYSWYLKDNTGTVLQSAVNSGSTEFNFTSSTIGALTLQCDVVDYYTNTSTSFAKSITCIYAPVSGIISTNMEEYSSFTTHSGTATIAITGGSNAKYCSWKLLSSNNENLQLYTGGTQFTFTCTETGTLKIECVITDLNMNTFTKVTKTIISK